MERTIPSTASEEVELYLRTYYSLLRSSAEVQIRTLEEAHAGMKSLLHAAAREQAPDFSAFTYSLLRLPPCMHQVQLVVLGQSFEVFDRGGYRNVETWQSVSAVARRRRCFFDGKETLACFIASRSDIDDVIPMLAAYQVEWNKLNLLLRRFLSASPDFQLEQLEGDLDAQRRLAEALQIASDKEHPLEDLERLRMLWGKDFVGNLSRIAAGPRHLRVQLLSGSLNEYRRATNAWWENIERACPELTRRPVYFISSNTHSLANLLSGYALRHQEHLVRFLKGSESQELLQEWEDIQACQVVSSQENFLYYVLKKYQASLEGTGSLEEQRHEEQACGILRISSEHSFEVDAQAIEIKKLRPEWLDYRLIDGDLSFLSRSEAMILNIDYPLGLAAYNILTEVAEQAGKVLGVYVMGKAASLNGAMGDIVIPNVVHDEHSQNTYLFANCFPAADIAPYLLYGAVLDNQKAVTVRGTFLQNTHYMDVFYREGYTDIEMEAGAYLSAVYEMYRPKRHPVNEIVNLYGLPFDLGIVHYVSDNPLSKGKNLAAGSLSYYGMDSTYAASIAVLRRIIRMERERMQVSVPVV
jgi:hypothetical protein